MASIFDQDPKTGLTGLETLLGNVVMPGQIGGKPTNKQMIDAAILRGSLELLKPRQAGENFASQLARGLQAGAEVGKSLQTDVDQMLKNIELREKLEEREEAQETSKFEHEVTLIRVRYRGDLSIN